jgi:hypothetical protein
VVLTAEKKEVCRVLEGKPEEKSSLGRYRYRWEGDIKVVVNEIG